MAGIRAGGTGPEFLLHEADDGEWPPSWAWARLGPADSLDLLEEMTVESREGAPCTGEAAGRTAAFVVRVEGDRYAIEVVDATRGLRFGRASLPEPSARLTVTCTAHEREIVVLASPAGALHEPGVPVVLRWSLSDGQPLSDPIRVGEHGGNALVAVVAGRLVVFVFRQDSTALAEAYELSSAGASLVARSSVTSDFGDSDLPRPLAAIPAEGGGSYLLYVAGQTLYLLPFSTSEGFGYPAVLTDAGCWPFAQSLVILPTGSFLVCEGLARPYLLIFCRASG